MRLWNCGRGLLGNATDSCLHDLTKNFWDTNNRDSQWLGIRLFVLRQRNRAVRICETPRMAFLCACLTMLPRIFSFFVAHFCFYRQTLSSKRGKKLKYRLFFSVVNSYRTLFNESKLRFVFKQTGRFAYKKSLITPDHSSVFFWVVFFFTFTIQVYSQQNQANFSSKPKKDPFVFPTNTIATEASPKTIVSDTDKKTASTDSSTKPPTRPFFTAFQKEEARQATHEGLLKQVQSTWKISEPSYSLPIAASASTEASLADTLQHFSRNVIIPQIHLEKVSFEDVLKILSETLAKHPTNPRTVNFVLVDPEHHAPEINLHLKEVSLARIIQYVSEMTKFTAVYEKNTIVFRDRSIQPTLKTCIFPVLRGSILQILNYTDNQQNEKKLSEEERLKQFFIKIGVPLDQKNVGFAYDGQNLIVTHEMVWLQRIEAILHRYQTCKQIAIEAKFLEVQQGLLEEIGIKWNSGTGEKYNNRVQLNIKDNLRNLSVLHSGSQATNSSNSPQFPNGLNYGNNIGDFLNANTILNRYQMNVILRAIDQHSDSDLLCAPKVTVLSGRKAEITIADELRYPENYRDGSSNVGNDARGSSAAGVTIVAAVPEKFTTRNVGVEMTVIPIAEENGNIHLSLEPRVTEFEGFVRYGGENVASSSSGTHTYDSGFYQPTFSTRKIKTEVSIQNGCTVVMGGLTREEVKETHDKVPLLGDIPLLGKIFQSKGQTSQKKSLLIFVTANLVNEKGQYIVEPEIPIQSTQKPHQR